MLYRAPFVHVMPPFAKVIRLVVFSFFFSFKILPPVSERIRDVVHDYAKICPCLQTTQNSARKGRRWKRTVGDWQHEASCRHHDETNTKVFTLSRCRLCRTARTGRRVAPSILRLYSESLPSTHPPTSVAQVILHNLAGKSMGPPACHFLSRMRRSGTHSTKEIERFLMSDGKAEFLRQLATIIVDAMHRMFFLLTLLSGYKVEELLDWFTPRYPEMGPCMHLT
jgi:hypothetical protein